MVLNKKVGSLLLGSLTVISLTSCSAFDTLMEADRIDYKSETPKTPGQRLEIPPDLTQMQRDNRYSFLKHLLREWITASGYTKKR